MINQSGPLLRTLPWLLVLLGVVRFLSYQAQYSGVGSDFVQDYVASLSFLRGYSIYGKDLADLANADLGFKGIENFHPPFSALLYAPLAMLSFDISFVLFNSVGATALFAAVIALARHFELNTRESLWACALLLNSYPFIFSVGSGQSSSLIVAGILGAWTLARARHDLSAGILLGLVTTLKIFPGIFILLFWICGFRRSALFAATVAAVVGGATWCVLGPEVISQYVFEIAPRNVREWAHFPINLSITSWLVGLCLQVHGPGGWTVPLVGLGDFVWLLANIVSLLVAVLGISWAYYYAKKGRIEKALSLAICCSVLVTPVSWQHFLSIVVFPLFFWWSRRSNKCQGINFVLLAVSFVLLSWPSIEAMNCLVGAYQPDRLPWWSLFIAKLPGFGVCFATWLALSSNELPTSSTHTPYV